MLDNIKANFTESIQTQIAATDTLSEPIATAAMMMVNALVQGHKLLACGNGGCGASAQQFVTNMLNRYERERPSLPAISLNADNTTLTAIAGDCSFDDVYSKQVRALGSAGDILLAICDSGNDKSVIRAMEAAVSRDMTIVALTGKDGGEMSGLLGTNDIEIRVPSNRNSRIQEVHLLTIHCLCESIDNMLFPEEYDTK